MATVSTRAASGSSSNTSEVRYTLRILRAEVAEELKNKSALYVEIKLPNGLQVLVHAVELSKLERNGNFDFASIHDAPIRVKLKKRQSVWFDMCLGEALVSVGDLNARCQGGQDYPLVLVNPRSKELIGTLFIQLQIKAHTSRTPSDVTSTRRMMENTRSKLVETLSVEYPDKSPSPTASTNAIPTTRESKDPDGFDILSRIRDQLYSMNSGKLKTAIGVIGAAAKIHPYIESSWKVVSLLHEAYQAKPKIDLEVVKVFTSMDHVLSFVEAVDKLKDQEHRFFNLVEESLRIIEECGTLILNYFNGDSRNRPQPALSRSSEEKLSYYQSQLKGLAEDLGRIVNVHVAHHVENTHEAVEGLAHHIKDNHAAVMQALERIDEKTPNTQPSSSTSFQSIIPPPPTDMFTGRGDYLQKIKESFGLPKTSVEMGRQRKFVLYGTGGIGKTQLALKFLDENREQFTVRYIVDASSHESIAASFANIGRDAGIPDADTHKVLNWLSKKIEEWILIFDNADNRDVKLRRYFPSCHYGNILITTRNADYESLAPSLEVSVLDDSSAISLLLRTAKLEETEENGETAQEIVGEFGHLALAIVQAGSYIRAERLTLYEYYERYERSRSSLLKSGPLKEELAYERPVYATWEISYAALSQFAKTVLDLCAFLYREGITEELWLRAVASDKAKLAMESEEDDPTAPKELLSLLRYLRADEDNDGEYIVRFREIVRELRSYSLIQEPFRGSFSIHPLVHSWARERMKSSYRSEARINASHLLHYSLRGSLDDLYMDYNFTRTTIPHIESCGKPPIRADIALEFAGVYVTCYRQNVPQAQRLVAIALIESKEFEVDNQNNYNTRNYLGKLYGWINRYPDAAEMHQILVEEKRRVLGNDHSSTLSSMFELATAYRNLGRLDDAQELLVEVIEARKCTLGNEHYSTIEGKHELALTYQDHGRFDDARKLFAEVLESRKRILGNNHSSTLYCMHDLALTYRYQGRWNDAQELFIEVIGAKKRVLGNNHSSTLYSMHELAVTYRYQGRWSDAQELFIEVIEAKKGVLGNDHSSTLYTMYELAVTYRCQGRWNDAQELLVEIIGIKKRVLGIDHFSTLYNMHELALTYRYQGRWNDAQELFVEVIKARKWTLGDDHPSTLVSMHELATMYRDRGRLDDAQQLLAEVTEARKQVLGNDHSSTLASMYYLGLTYRDQGRLDNAQELLAKVVEASKRVLGNDHSSTLVSMYELALTYRSQGRLDDAQKLLSSVIEAEKQVLGHDHFSTLYSMHDLALIYQYQGRLDGAQQLFSEVVEARKRVLGNDHYDTLASMYELASTYLRQNCFADAEETGIEVYERCKRAFGLFDYRTLASRDLLIKIYTQQGRLGDVGRLKALNSNRPQTN